jgi:replicative DNA helicase
MGNFETVKENTNLTDYANDHLEKLGNGRLVCPNCKSGTGPHKSPAFSITDKHWTCFSCYESGDVYDLAGIIHNTDDKTEQLKLVADWANIPLQVDRKPIEKALKPIKKKSESKPALELAPTLEQGRTHERDYLAQCARALEASPAAVDYLQMRGFTIEEAKRFGFGYSKTDKHGEELTLPFIGSSDYYYTARDITEKRTFKYRKPPRDNVGEAPLFDPDILENTVFFIVEGVLDAYAIKALGYSAFATTGGASHRIVEYFTNSRFRGGVIILADNDGGKGLKIMQPLKDALDKAGILNELCLLNASSSIKANYKDACEALAKDRIGLNNFLDLHTKTMLAKVLEVKEKAYIEALKDMHIADSLKVISEIGAGVNEPAFIPTGFNSLDKQIGGGLTDGFLYVIGAVSSLGKTTFCVQVADYIATQGREVLFVSIEQSAKELIAKSVSRLMSIQGHAASTSELLHAQRRQSWDSAKYTALGEVCNSYNNKTLKNIKILEPVKQPHIADIKTIAGNMCDHSGRQQAPVIFIDYLQLIAPENETDTDKRIVDNNVRALRQLARELKTPVFVISSLNRSSYASAVEMESFKESGSIEYSADVLLGLQPRGAETIADNDKKGKAKGKADLKDHKARLLRACEITVLKNRNGGLTKEGLPFTFRAAESRFVEGD